jgi:hypothetical protein
MGDVRLTPRQLAALFDALDTMTAGAQLVRQVLIEAMAARHRRQTELRVIGRREDTRPARKTRSRV